MSPIVYVPQKNHKCEPPRNWESIDSPEEDGWYPEGTIWECEECDARWELEYSPCETFWCGIVYSYYEIKWRLAHGLGN